MIFKTDTLRDQIQELIEAHVIVKHFCSIEGVEHPVYAIKDINKFEIDLYNLIDVWAE